MAGGRCDFDRGKSMEAVTEEEIGKRKEIELKSMVRIQRMS